MPFHYDPPEGRAEKPAVLRSVHIAIMCAVGDFLNAGVCEDGGLLAAMCDGSVKTTLRFVDP
jgi:hypothetical protein